MILFLKYLPTPSGLSSLRCVCLGTQRCPWEMSCALGHQMKSYCKSLELLWGGRKNNMQVGLCTAILHTTLHLWGILKDYWDVWSSPGMSSFPVCLFRHVQYLPDEEQTYDPHWWVKWLYVQISDTQFVLSQRSHDLKVMFWSCCAVPPYLFFDIHSLFIIHNAALRCFYIWVYNNDKL